MSDSSCQTEKKFVPKNPKNAPNCAPQLPSVAAAAAPVADPSCSQENEVGEIYFLDAKQHMSQPQPPQPSGVVGGRCRDAIQSTFLHNLSQDSFQDMFEVSRHVSTYRVTILVGENLQLT